MANYCDYKGILKGRKNACYAAYGCFQAYDDKWIVKECGTNEDYFLQFEGNCKWSESIPPPQWEPHGVQPPCRSPVTPSPT